MPTDLQWISKKELRKEVAGAMLCGFLLGILAALILTTLLREAKAEIPEAMVRGCKLPTKEGESTQLMIIDGRPRCFRYY